MKTIKLALILALFFNSCASKKEMSKEIEFAIIDKSVKDNSFINLQISNKTSLNYYLPIINLPESEKWKYELSSDQNRFFFIYKVGYNFNNEKRHWISENCISERDVELEESYELWNKKKKSIGVKNLILLKSGESIKIKVPMDLHIKISKFCNWELEGYKSEKLDIGINYPNKDQELAIKFLSSKTLDSLKQMGYELYDKEINSNKVPLKW